MLCVHPGQGQQLCSFFSNSAVRVSQANLWEKEPASCSRPHPGTRMGDSCGSLGVHSIEVLCVLGQRVSGWVNRRFSPFQQGGKRKLEAVRALRLAVSVWSRFLQEMQSVGST